MHISTGKGFYGRLVKQDWSSRIYEAMVRNLQNPNNKKAAAVTANVSLAANGVLTVNVSRYCTVTVTVVVAVCAPNVAVIMMV